METTQIISLVAELGAKVKQAFSNMETAELFVRVPHAEFVALAKQHPEAAFVDEPFLEWRIGATTLRLTSSEAIDLAMQAEFAEAERG